MVEYFVWREPASYFFVSLSCLRKKWFRSFMPLLLSVVTDIFFRCYTITIIQLYSQEKDSATTTIHIPTLRKKMLRDFFQHIYHSHSMRRLVYYKGFVTLMRTELGVYKTCFFYKASHRIKSIHLKTAKKKYKYIEKYIFHIKSYYYFYFQGSPGKYILISPRSEANVSSSAPVTSGSSMLKSPGHRRIREGKKCRKVYGLEQRDLWCTQCKWKKACARFGNPAGAGAGTTQNNNTETSSTSLLMPAVGNHHANAGISSQAIRAIKF